MYILCATFFFGVNKDVCVMKSQAKLDRMAPRCIMDYVNSSSLTTSPPAFAVASFLCVNYVR